jgi:hypothetical protein
VVNASQIDPRLSGTAIIVFDRKRISDLSSPIDRSKLDRSISTLESKFRDQITANASEWTVTKINAELEKSNASNASATPTLTGGNTPRPSTDQTSVSNSAGAGTATADVSGAMGGNGEGNAESSESETWNQRGRYESADSNTASDGLITEYRSLIVLGSGLIGVTLVLSAVVVSAVGLLKRGFGGLSVAQKRQIAVIATVGYVCLLFTTIVLPSLELLFFLLLPVGIGAFLYAWYQALSGL